MADTLTPAVVELVDVVAERFYETYRKGGEDPFDEASPDLVGHFRKKAVEALEAFGELLIHESQMFSASVGKVLLGALADAGWEKEEATDGDE